MVSLGNPLIGEVPQPQKENQEVFNPLIPSSNYGAQVITPQLNDPVLILLEVTTSGTNVATDTEYTTDKIVLTGILISRTLYYSGGAIQWYCDIYINSDKIISFNDQLPAALPLNQDFYIPIQHVLFNSNTLFKLEAQRQGGAGGSGKANVSFIGYKNPKL